MEEEKKNIKENKPNDSFTSETSTGVEKKKNIIKKLYDKFGKKRIIIAACVIFALIMAPVSYLIYDKATTEVYKDSSDDDSDKISKKDARQFATIGLNYMKVAETKFVESMIDTSKTTSKYVCYTVDDLKDYTDTGSTNYRGRIILTLDNSGRIVDKDIDLTDGKLVILGGDVEKLSENPEWYMYTYTEYVWSDDIYNSCKSYNSTEKKEDDSKNTEQQDRESEDEELSIDKVLNVSSINMSKELPGYARKPEKLNELKTTSTFKPLLDDQDDYIEYSYSNKTLRIKTNYNDDIKNYEFKNIDKVYYSSSRFCSPDVEIYMISGDKVYYIDGIEFADSISPKEYLNNSYSEIYNMYVHVQTCGAKYIGLGKTNDGTFYDIEKNLKVDVNVKYNYFDILKANRDLTINGVLYKTKAVIKDWVEDDIKYIIDENNYLYEVSTPENGGFVVSTKSSKKVKSINLHIDGDAENVEEIVNIVADDGSILEEINGGYYIQY